MPHKSTLASSTPQVEHCNDAESLVAGIEAAGKGEGETEEVETHCKLAQVLKSFHVFLVIKRALYLNYLQVDMYIQKLRERDRRKTVVKELGLVEAFFKVARLNHIWPSRTILGANWHLCRNETSIYFKLIRKIL